MSSLSEVLFGNAKRSLRASWDWWTTELRELVPSRAWSGRSKTAYASIHPLRDAVEIERVGDGVGERFVAPSPIDELDDESWQQLEELVYGRGAQLVLSHPDVFSIRIDLPRAARTRLRSAVALQLSELAPLDPAYLTWTIDRVKRIGDRVQIGVTMAQRRHIEALGQLFEARNIPLPPIFAAVEDREVLLAPGFRGDQSGSSSATRKRALIVMGLLAAVPLLTIIGATALTARNEQASTMLETIVQPRLESDRRARQAERLRQGLAKVYGFPSASGLIEDLAKRLPNDAHAVSLSRGDAGTIELAVETADPDTVRPLLTKDPALPNVREVRQVKTDRGTIRVDYVAG